MTRQVTPATDPWGADWSEGIADRRLTARRVGWPGAGRPARGSFFGDGVMFDLATLGTTDLNGPEGQVRSVLAQPKRTALLVRLARAGTGWSRRDTLLGLFWPDLDQSRARSALRQAIRFLRRSLGADAVEGEGEDLVRVNPARVQCDASLLEADIDAGRLAEGLDRYRGDFLAGFFVAGAGPELDQWIDDERAQLRRLAKRAAVDLAERARTAGSATGAVAWLRRAIAIEPDDEALQRELIGLLEAAGDRAGALRVYAGLSRRLAREFDVAPSPSTEAIIDRLRSAAPTAPAAANNPGRAGAASLAVVPFADADADPFLGAAIADGIREALRRIPMVELAPRVEHPVVDLAAAGRSMSVASVLGGSVNRTTAGVSVNGRLVSSSDGRTIWEETFDRPLIDPAEIVERLTRAIVTRLSIRLTAESEPPLVHRPTSDPEAHLLYLRGRHHWTRRPRDTSRGLRCFEQAIERDPLFALAHAGLADAYNTLGSWEGAEMPPWEAFPRAHAAAHRALSIDPGLGAAWAPLGYSSMHYRWDFERARRELARAIVLDPANANARHWNAHLLLACGQREEALAESRRALDLEPVDLIMNVHLAWHFWMAREFDAALDQCRRTAELEPHDHWPAYFQGMALIGLGLYDEAVRAHTAAVTRSGENRVMLGALGHSLGLAGDSAGARRILRRLLDAEAAGYQSAYEVALVQLAIGDIDLTFDWLSRAIDERSAWMPYLRLDPRLDPLRSDPRLAAIEAGVFPIGEPGS